MLLGELCEVTPSPSSDLFTGLTADFEGTSVVTPADITNSQRVHAEALRRIPGPLAGLERFLLHPGDLVLVRLGGVGRVALIDKSVGTWVYHSSCIRIRPDTDRIDPVYLAAYLAHPPVVDQLLSRAQVGTVPVLTAGSLETLPVVMPALHTQRLMSGALRELSLQMDVQRQILTRLDAVQQGLFAHLLGDGLRGLDISRPRTSRPEHKGPRTRRTNRMS